MGSDETRYPATVVQIRKEDGAQVVQFDDPPQPFLQPVWLCGRNRTRGVDVGDRGYLVYRVTPPEGLWWFVEEPPMTDPTKSDLAAAAVGCPECGGSGRKTRPTEMAKWKDVGPCPTCAHTARLIADAREEGRGLLRESADALTELRCSCDKEEGRLVLECERCGTIRRIDAYLKVQP